MMNRAAVLGLLLAGSFAPEARTVPFCELARHEERYRGAVVRTRAAYFASPETAFLYDLACNGEDSRAELMPSCDEAQSCFAIWDKIREAEERRPEDGLARAELTLVGRLEGWNGFGYGPRGEMRLQFKVDEIEEVEPVQSDLPWPDQAQREPGPFTEGIKQLRDADARLCSALASGDKHSLQGLTTAEFIFTTEAGKDPSSKAGFLDSFRPLCATEGNYSCTTTAVDISKSIASVSGLIECGSTDGTPHTYQYHDTYIQHEGGFKAFKGQLVFIESKAQLRKACRDGAAQIFRQLRELYDSEPEWTEAEAADLPEAYAGFQQRVEGQMREMGFERVGTLRDGKVARLYPQNTPLFEVFVGAEGDVTAAAFWMAGHDVFGFTTQFLDGRVVITKNAELDPFTPPPGFDKRVLPLGTPVERVLTLHRDRLASPRYKTAQAIRFTSLDRLCDLERERFAAIQRHRIAVGYLTRPELESFALRKVDQQEVLNLVWAEFRRLVKAHEAEAVIPGAHAPEQK